MTCTRDRENFYYSAYVHKYFIAAICLFKDMGKVLGCLHTINRFMFEELCRNCVQLVIAKILFLKM